MGQDEKQQPLGAGNGFQEAAPESPNFCLQGGVRLCRNSEKAPIFEAIFCSWKIRSAPSKQQELEGKKKGMWRHCQKEKKGVRLLKGKTLAWRFRNRKKDYRAKNQGTYRAKGNYLPIPRVALVGTFGFALETWGV